MSNKILKITESKQVETTLPDGAYRGRWTGYVIDVYLHPIKYQMKTEEGVRGFNIPVIVTIKNGIAVFKEID